MFIPRFTREDDDIAELTASDVEDIELFRRMQERNLLRQTDLLIDSLYFGIKYGPLTFDKHLVCALNYSAMANISESAGKFREEPIHLPNSPHIPPHYSEVPNLIDRFVIFVRENWHFRPTELAAFALWRLNWIHPFTEGNGRTARAVSYYILSARSRLIFGGRKLVIERIRESKQEYEEYLAALREADEACKEGQYDVTRLDAQLKRLLIAQLKGENSDTGSDIPASPSDAMRR